MIPSQQASYPPPPEAAAKLSSAGTAILVGALLDLIGMIIAWTGGIGIMALLTDPKAVLAGAATIVVSFIVLSIIGLILNLIGLKRLADAAQLMRDAGAVQVSPTGPKLMLGSFALLILALLVLMGGVLAESLGVALGGAGLALIAALLALVGFILTGIMLMRMNTVTAQYGVTGLDTAGILWILSILPYIGVILWLISAYMIYKAGQELEQKLASIAPTTPGAQPPPSPGPGF